MEELKEKIKQLTLENESLKQQVMFYPMTFKFFLIASKFDIKTNSSDLTSNFVSPSDFEQLARFYSQPLHIVFKLWVNKCTL